MGGKTGVSGRGGWNFRWVSTKGMTRITFFFFEMGFGWSDGCTLIIVLVQICT